jgi:hypothetical protein
MDQFDCGSGMLHAFGGGAGDFTGSQRQQRAYPLAAAQHRVAHRLVQALRRNLGRGEPLGQHTFHACLACLCPGGKISHRYLRS